MRLLAVNNKSNKTNSEKRILYFSHIRLQKQHSSLTITLSMELAKTQCYEFECFEDDYSLTISMQGCRINTRKFNTKGT